MKQDDLKDIGGAWPRASEFATRHQHLFEIFETFSRDAATLETEGELAGRIKVTPAGNHCDVTFCGRTFRFRFESRAAQAGHRGHIVMREIDPLTNQEGKAVDFVTFDGDGTLIGLKDPRPIRLNAAAARTLVVLEVYNAVARPA